MKIRYNPTWLSLAVCVSWNKREVRNSAIVSFNYGSTTSWMAKFFGSLFGRYFPRFGVSVPVIANLSRIATIQSSYISGRGNIWYFMRRISTVFRHDIVPYVHGWVFVHGVHDGIFIDGVIARVEADVVCLGYVIKGWRIPYYCGQGLLTSGCSRGHFIAHQRCRRRGVVAAENHFRQRLGRIWFRRKLLFLIMYKESSSVEFTFKTLLHVK